MRESRENRAERLSERAEKKRKEADAITSQAMKMASVIPMGQPILIGHHSERRDRNYREKIGNKMRKGAELADYAEELERRARASARNTAIYADALDPVADIDAKIAKLEVERNALKAREHKSWELTNIGANIRRLKLRRESLAKMKATDKSERVVNGVKVIENPDIARIQLVFNGKPSDDVREELKYNGFRWAPSENAWQRNLNANGKYAAEVVLNYISEHNEPR